MASEELWVPMALLLSVQRNASFPARAEKPELQRERIIVPVSEEACSWGRLSGPKPCMLTRSGALQLLSLLQGLGACCGSRAFCSL